MSIPVVTIPGYSRKVNPAEIGDKTRKSKRLTADQQDRSEEIIRTEKRKAEEIPDDPLPKRLKLIDGQKKRSEEPNPVFECTRDEIIQYGLQVQAARDIMHVRDFLMQHQDDSLEIEQVADPMEVDEEESLDDPRLQELMEISKDRSGYVGSILSAVYDFCETKEGQYPRSVKSIMKFALSLASALPSKTNDEMEISDEEIAPEFLESAKKIVSVIGMSVAEEEVRKVAKKMQKDASALHELSLEKENFSISEQEKQIGRVLGGLLFLLEKDLRATLQLISNTPQAEVANAIMSEARLLISETNASIKEHSNLHKKSGLQVHQLANFKQITIEMAKLLMMENGLINVGLIDDVFELIIPEEMRHFESIKSMRHIMDQLRMDPELWLIISEVKAPKSPELPSNELIRACLNIPHDQQITERDAKITVLSAALQPIRQAKAGTCFATALLIKLMHSELHSCLRDFSELIENGMIDRQVDHVSKRFGFQIRTTKESLDSLLTVTPEGKIIRIEARDDSREAMEKHSKKTYPIFLQNCPGIEQACQTLEIKDVGPAVLQSIQQFDRPFTIYELLIELAKISFERRNAFKYTLRSTTTYTLEQLKEKAFYAFGAQTNHPLHRAWEQSATQMFDFFGSQYGFPNWTFGTLKTTMKRLTEHLDGKYKRMQKSFLLEMLLPMITRMQYRYNHHFEKENRLFEDVRYGSENDSYYGYELWDSGLPTDFKYSRKFARQISAHTGWMKIHQFNEFSTPIQWKIVDTEEKFQQFVIDVMQETIGYLKTKPEDPYAPEAWDEFSVQFTKVVMSDSFPRKMIEGVFGKDSSQRKKLKKNEFTIASTPWKFKWGGDPDSVLKGYYNFKDLPAKQLKFNGTPKEVLAWTINYLKKQPKSIQEKYNNPFALIPIIAPGHAFLLRPGEASLMQAYLSDQDTVAYISEHVEAPGLEVSNMTASVQMRTTLVNYIAKNFWVKKGIEVHDFDKIQLTSLSQEVFNVLLDQTKEKYIQFTVGQFREKLFQIVIQSRTQDERIGKRYLHWEQQFKTILDHKFKEYLPEASDDDAISEESMEILINFARNKEDNLSLSPEYAAKFREEANLINRNLSIKDFRQELLDLAIKIRNQEQGKIDKKWEKSVQPNVDSRIYKLLSEEQKEKLLSSAIVSHDTNWCDEVHYLYFAFLINPGSGKLELCRYNPDTKSISFQHQGSWFPKNEKYAMRWQLPDNYRAFSSERLFKHREFLYR